MKAAICRLNRFDGSILLALRVDTLALAQSAALTPARLLIDAGDEIGASSTRFETTLRRLRSLYSQGAHGNERAPLCVQIVDLQGHRVFASTAVGPLIDISLPAGTYHVTAQLGKVRRCYTMALQIGASFHLHLRLASHLK